MGIQEQLRAAMEAAQRLAQEEARIDASVSAPLVTAPSPSFEEAAGPGNDDATVAEFPENHIDDEVSVASPAESDDDPEVFDEPTSQPVNTLTRQTVQIKNLDEKAVLVQVKRRMYSPYKLDEAESKAYGAGNVNKHLFQGTDNRVKKAISKYTEVYTFVKDNTVPWTTGVELLNITHYMEFTSGLRQRIDEANAAVADLVAHWDYEVQDDLRRLQDIAYAKGKPNLADPNDYPSADEVEKRFGIEVRYMPVPSTGDFRVGISDEDKATLQQQLDDATTNATRHVLTQMIEPMQRAVKKLTVPIGDDGHIFRDSLIDNMVDVAYRMAKVNVSDDPVIAERIRDLQSLVSTYANNKDVLRSSQTVREKAATQIDALCNQMAGLV
jgi:hypothetical protein